MEIAFGLVFAAFLLGFLVVLIRGNRIRRLVAAALEVAGRREAENDRAPVQSAPATVIAKRSQVSGFSGGSTDTWYFCTFQFASGERREFGVRGEDFGKLAEGDKGLLNYQGTRFLRYDRAPVEEAGRPPGSPP
jgi:hypothetical protein